MTTTDTQPAPLDLDALTGRLRYAAEEWDDHDFYMDGTDLLRQAADKIDEQAAENERLRGLVAENEAAQSEMRAEHQRRRRDLRAARASPDEDSPTG